MKIYLDDDVFRLLDPNDPTTFTRCPSKSYRGEKREDWFLTTNPYVVYELLINPITHPTIEVVSFDNDIGLRWLHKEPLRPIEGRDVLRWLEEDVVLHGLDLSHVDLRIHSANGVARYDMEQAIRQIKRASNINYGIKAQVQLSREHSKPSKDT